MRVLILGGGGISAGVRKVLRSHDVTEVPHSECDVRSFPNVIDTIGRYDPQWVVNCAGVSRPDDPALEVATNLTGTINVAGAAAGRGMVMIASVAGMYGKPGHLGYCASKAGVISVVQSLAMQGERAFCVSPGRVDTPMRQRDYPDDTPGSRLRPEQIGRVVDDILRGTYMPGTNIVIRKVGLDTVVVTEHTGDGWKERLSVGQPKTI